VSTGPTVAGIIARAGELGALPASWHQLDAVAAKPTSTTDDLGAAIGTDAGLTAKLLRLANSPLFGLAGRIESITRAVTMIGTRQIRDLALATMVIDKFKDIPPTLVEMPQFWRHSLGCALLARSIASQRREANVERFFVAGLLHDVGTLLLFLQEPKRSTVALSLLSEGTCSSVAAEKRVFGFDHAAVSEALLVQWGLPNSLSIPIGCHHVPGMGEAFPLETAVLHVASTTVDLLALGGRIEGLAPPCDIACWDRLGLPVEVMSNAPNSMPRLNRSCRRSFPEAGATR
jgi:HD-like signal output (HDOD) protein